MLTLLTLTVFSTRANSQEKISHKKMQWFADAKLGIFIHWGIYAVNGIPESWSFFNNYINYADYKKQLDGFTATNYDPGKWVNLIKESGAKYAVITSKHHDGVSLWDSKQPDALTIPRHSTAHKDVLTPFVGALKKSGLKTGIYFSLPDWSYKNYDVFTGSIKRYDIKKEPARFEKFVNYYQGQLSEISRQFNPDLLWFDGDWEHSAEEWKAAETKAMLQRGNPQIIINSRLKEHGDYATPEQGVPVQRPADQYWELCYTMNDSWGYQPFDRHYKTPFMIINTLVDCISMGGNLLLDIGPKADGTIAPEQVNILKALGRWTKKHAEAIYGTRAGNSRLSFPGRSALSGDGKTLFLYLDHRAIPSLKIGGVRSPIRKVSVVGTNQEIPFNKMNGNYELNLHSVKWDQDITVLKLSLEEPLSLSSPVQHIAVPNFSDYLKNAHQEPGQVIRDICFDLSEGRNCFLAEPLVMNEQNKNTTIRNAPQPVKQWILKNTEALAQSGKGLSQGHYAGMSALSADKKTIYLFVEGRPSGPIALKGISNQIARIRIAGDGTLLDYKMYDKLYWSATPGLVYIDIPETRLDKFVTVIAVLLDGPVKEYRHDVKPIESNL